MTSLVDAHPAMIALKAERDDYSRKRAAHASRMTQLYAARDKILSDWNELATSAVLDGQEPPPKPDVPDVPEPAGALAEFDRRSRELDERHAKVLVEISAEIEEAAAKAYAEAIKEAMPAARKLNDVAAKVASLQADLQRTRTKVDMANNAGVPQPRGRGNSTLQRCTASDVLAAVAQDVSLIEPQLPRAPKLGPAGPEPDLRPPALSKPRTQGAYI